MDGGAGSRKWTEWIKRMDVGPRAHGKKVNWAGCLVAFFSNVVLGDGFG